MKNKKWMAAVLAALAAFAATPASVFAEEAPAEHQSEQQLAELGGELNISGRAYVGSTLSADLSQADPSWISSDDLWFSWFRKDANGDRVDLGTDPSYTISDSDLGYEISLWVSGKEDHGYTGGLSASSYPVAATEQDALSYAAGMGDSEAAAALSAMQGTADASSADVQQDAYADTYESQTYDNDQAVTEEVYFAEGSTDTAAQPEQQQVEYQEQAEQQPAEDVQITTEEVDFELPPVDEPAPVYSAAAYTADGSGALDFGTLTEGETDSAQEQFVTITNTGTGAVSFSMISPEHFMVEDINTPLDPGESVTVWVVPRAGLASGEYNDTITYSSNEGAEASFTVRASVQAAPEEDVSELDEEMEEDDELVIQIGEHQQMAAAMEDSEDVDGPELQPAEPQAETIPETQTETDTQQEVQPQTETEVQPEQETEVPSDTEAEPQPETESETEKDPQQTGEEAPEPEPSPSPEPEPSVTPEPSEAPVLAVSADPVSIEFPEVTAGYTEAPGEMEVTLTNTGNVQASLTQPGAQYFEIGAISSAILAPGETATFTIQPALGLAAGTYSENVNIFSAENGTLLNSVAVAFVVKEPEKVIKLTAAPDSLEFGTMQSGYSEAPAAQTVTLKNDGNVTLTLQQPEAESYQISALSSAVLAPGETATFTVQPKSGLAEGTYSEAIIVTTAEEAEAVTVANFIVSVKTVELVGITAPSDITGVKNGTAKTAEALGLPQTVVIQTTNGDMKSNVTWDVNGCSYDPSAKTAQTFTVTGALQLPAGIENPREIKLYTSVKVTVNARDAIVPDPSSNLITGIAAGGQYTTESKITFTAVGAGMDNAAPVSGDVRYVPYKWNLVEDRTFESAPYTATFRIAQPNTYTVKVTFNQQQYDGSTWNYTGVQDVKQVSFTVTGAGIATLTPTPEAKRGVATGDDTNVAPLVIGLVGAAVIIGGAAFLLIRKKRK